MSTEPITPSHSAPSASRASDLAFLRQQSGPEAVTRAALEALGAGLYISPAFLFFFFLDGLLAVKYPRVLKNTPAPPPPQSFPGVVAFAARHSATCSARGLAFLVATNTLSAAGREAARLGPRFAENDPTGGIVLGTHGSGKIAGLGFLAGTTSALLLTADWARVMGRGRRGIYVALAGMTGVMLPHAIAIIGPSVKRSLGRLSPAPSPTP